MLRPCAVGDCDIRCAKAAADILCDRISSCRYGNKRKARQKSEQQQDCRNFFQNMLPPFSKALEPYDGHTAPLHFAWIKPE